MASNVSKVRLWTGRVISALPVLLMLFSGSMKLAKPPSIVEGFAQFGYSEKVIRPLGIVEVTCALLFVIPRTSVLGAILVTGYLGGAVATHVRAGQPVFVVPAVLGALAWLGLLLREPRLGSLLPLRR